MTDQQDTTPDEQAPQAQPESNADRAAPKPTETVDFWKRKAREQEARAKANADAAERLRQIEDAQKSAEQRAAEERARQAEEVRALQAERDRLQVANSRGIPASHMNLLGNGTLDELKDNAKTLADLLDRAGKWDAHQAALVQTQVAPQRLGQVGALVGASPVRPPAPSPGAGGIAEAARRFGQAQK